jgi:hypothetical protein
MTDMLNMNTITTMEYHLPKVCLTPHRQVDRNIYNPAKIRKILEAYNVSGVKQVFIPIKEKVAHASIIFVSTNDRDSFLKRFSNGLMLTNIETDKLLVEPWYSSDEREHHRVRKNLAKSRSFFCRDIPANLSKESLLEQLPNSDAIVFTKIMLNGKNGNSMASFCYKTISDAGDFVTLCSTGVFRLTVDEKIYDIHVEPYKNMAPRATENNVATDASSLT